MRFVTICLFILGCSIAGAQSLPVIGDIEVQPTIAHAERLAESLEFLGTPLGENTRRTLDAIGHAAPTPVLTEHIQNAFDPYCIAFVHINPEGRVKVAPGPATARLVQGGWSTFLVKVHNEAGLRSALNVRSDESEPALHRSSGQPHPKEENLLSEGEVANRFLELALYTRRPMSSRLSGFPLEYFILQGYTNETGAREASLAFDAGEGSQDLGFRNEIAVLFDCVPSVKLTLRVKDHDGEPAMASFTISDRVERLATGREVFPKDYRVEKAQRREWEGNRFEGDRLTGIYPLPSRRVAMKDEFPDFYFQPQIYRADGEHVFLAPGEYTVEWTRGPEYIPQTRTITVPEGVSEHEESFQLKRWIHMAGRGWYSADHHVHGGGCSHYESPEAGVQPVAMMRQALGEDLNISCVLSWGPCWYHQKTFFEGDIHELSTETNLMRYDVEVSGFPSSHGGHLCLLRLKEDDYPGTTKIEEWPSWTLPVLQWGQEQGGVVGYSHSGWGLEPMEPTEELPNYVMAKFDGIGANEYIVTVVHDAVDFISAGDTPITWEMNIWYHTLNCGFRANISGETDFPCIFDERIGMARSYAPLEGALSFDGYTELIRDGANYVSDGFSHIIDFTVNDTKMGQGGGEVRLKSADTVTVSAKVAAYLPEKQTPEGAGIVANGINGRPYWHVEKARIGQSREVPVELVVNGLPVEQQIIEANGDMKDLTFETPIEKSSWVALRILASAHTNPIYVLVDGKPIRASRKSAEWCRAAVDQCWSMKENAIHEEDKDAARAGYDVARKAYDAIIAESTND